MTPTDFHVGDYPRNPYSMGDTPETKRVKRNEADRAAEQAWITDRVQYAIDNQFTDKILDAYATLADVLGYTFAAKMARDEIEKRRKENERK